VTATVDPAPARRAAPAPWLRNAVFATVGAAIVLGWVGDAVWASLVDRHPLTLILLNAKPRYLVLTVNDLDWWSYYPVALVRLLCTKPLVWLIGAWYGDRAVRWSERRSARGGGLVRWIEEHFGRFGWVVVAITSNNAVCLLAGSTGFSLAWFMVLAVVGTLVRLWLIEQAGAAFAEPIDSIIGFVADHRVPVLVVSIAVVAGGLWWQRRTGTSGLDELNDLERAMEDDKAADD